MIEGGRRGKDLRRKQGRLRGKAGNDSRTTHIVSYERRTLALRGPSVQLFALGEWSHLNKPYDQEYIV